MPEDLVPTLEKPFPVGKGLRQCLPERESGVDRERMDAMATRMEQQTHPMCAQLPGPGKFLVQSGVKTHHLPLGGQASGCSPPAAISVTHCRWQLHR